jgi:signal transduction histidine kinase
LRPHGAPPFIEAAIAGVAALAAFAGAGAAFAAVGSDVAAAAVAAAYLAAVVVIARRAGVVYAVPLAMVGFLACDWFYVPPTHAYGLPTSANLVELLAFVTVGVLIGRLAGDAIRRAERSERANIRARAELADSRARVVAAAHTERRRVVRDLHDGAQQRLVQTILTLKLAERALPREAEAGVAYVKDAIGLAELATAELRELARGILPAVLTRGGLSAAIEPLASRMPMPVEVDVNVGRLPGAVEATAYFVIAEALTNVAKHAGAGRALVAASLYDHTVRVEVKDDGVGGARSDGSGLLGLADRLAAHDGRLELASPRGGGTLLRADIPLSG